MVEYEDKDLAGSRFYEVILDNARFEQVTFQGARFHNVDLRGLRITGAEIPEMVVDGEILSLVVNGVEVAQYVEAELDKRYPERAKMRPTDAAGFREAWDIVERLWAGTVDRYRALPADKVHEQVYGEWSFVENLRHLVFATNAWVKRMLLRDPSPWSPLDFPHDNMLARPGIPKDRDVRPSLDEVLALRADRMASVREVIAGLTDERLDEQIAPPTEPGYPDDRSFGGAATVSVRECLLVILNEEFMHRLYVERNLAALVG